MARKAAALLALTSLLQPGLMTPRSEQKELSLAEMDYAQRAKAIHEGARLLKKLRSNDLRPYDVPQSHYRLSVQGKFSEQLTLEDLRDQFAAGPYGGVVDNWARYTDRTPPTADQLRTYELHTMQNQVFVETMKRALSDPSLPIEQCYRDALESAGVERLAHYRKMPISPEDVGTPMVLLDLFDPETAIRNGRLDRIEQQVMHARKVLREVTDVAKREGVPAEELAVAVSGYWQPGHVAQAAPRQKQGERDMQPFAYDVKRMVFGMLPYMRRFHEKGIDAVLFADCNARAIGKVFEYVHEELGINPPAVRYVKFCSPDKMAEGLALTGAVPLHELERSTLERNALLRRTDLLTPQDVAGARTLYDSLSARAFALQVAAAKPLLADLAGKSAVVVDDWVKSGSTRRNMEDLLDAMGIRFEDALMTIDTPLNEHAAMVRDVSGMSKEYLKDLSWRKNLPWYEARCVGVNYGIDTGTQDPAKLFRLQRDLRGYELSRPANHFYSGHEIEQIANNIADGVFADDSMMAVREQIVHDAAAALRSYHVKQGFDATCQQVNVLRTRGFYSALRCGVQMALREAQAEFGDGIKNYASGARLKVSEAGVEAMLRDAVDELAA